MKIIINSHIEDYIATRLVHSVIVNDDKALERECAYRYTYEGKDVIVSSIKNKNSMRFEVFYYKEQENG